MLDSVSPEPVNPASVMALIVAFQPDIALLRQAVDAAASQTGSVLVFDNASSGVGLDAFYDEIGARADVVRSDSNLGIGGAVNYGLREAQRRQVAYLLVLDQDSVVNDGTVDALVSAMTRHAAAGKVAAVGAQFYDARTGTLAPFIRVGFPMSKKVYGGPGQTVECDFLISSGSLINVAAIADVGEMDESLFIDNVDLEWSFRARHRGYKLFGVCDARMAHQIGEHVDVPLIGKQTVHSPTRLYYIMRNRVLLYARPETPRVWIAQDVPRVLLKFLKMALFVRPRRRYVRAMLSGLRDGIRGRVGRIGS